MNAGGRPVCEDAMSGYVPTSVGGAPYISADGLRAPSGTLHAIRSTKGHLPSKSRQSSLLSKGVPEFSAKARKSALYCAGYASG